jgi:DNA-binding MarR family transcriptional regulator
MLSDKETKVLQIVQMGGPKLPTEIAKIVGIDTYITSAILSALVKHGHLHNSSRKIGSSLIYYTDGQEENVRNLLLKELNDLEKKALERVRELRLAFEDDLYPQERFLLNELKDFTTQIKIKTDDEKELTCWKYYDVSEDEMKNRVQVRLSAAKNAEEQYTAPSVPNSRHEQEEKLVLVDRPKLAHKKITRVLSSGFAEKINNYLKGIDAETVSVLHSKTNELTSVVKVPTILGCQNFLLFALNKKSVSESDLSKIYVESSKERKPVLLFVTNELSTKANKYVEKYFGDILKVVKI